MADGAAAPGAGGERWERLAELFDALLALPPGEREAALDTGCSGDPELRRELERLLAADAAAEDVLSPFAALRDAVRGAAGALHDPLDLAGRDVGPYAIDALLGAGGMGVVYRARDRRLDRPVALKFLPAEWSRDEVARQRLLREARAIAALDHPNVCTIHEVGESDDGRLFIAMALYEGKTLRERLVDGPLPPEEALALVAQAARGLAYAHDHGIVHRDVKPENLLVTRDGSLKILDFGLARRDRAPLSEPGQRGGTAFYMSPEQAAGEPVDERTDLWALGVVLYELLTGSRPFRGDDPLAVLLAIRTKDPPVPSSARADLPAALDELVRRLLAREPARRPGGAAEVEGQLNAIRALLQPDSPAERRRRPSASQTARRRAGSAVAGVAVGLALLAVALRGGELLREPSLLARGLVEQHERLLVGDFGSQTGDTLLARAVTEALRVDLERSPVVRVVDRAYVVEVLGRMLRDPATPVRGEIVREVALRDGVKAYVEGDVSAAGLGFVLTARLVAPGVERPLVALREAARDSADLIAAVDRLSRTLRRRLGEPLRSIQASEPLERITTSSLAALQLYARGSHAYHVRGDHTGARDLLLEAIRLDTAFGMAYRKLGVVRFTDTETQVRSLERAYAFRDRLPLVERLTIAGTYHSSLSFNPSGAFRAYRQLLEVDPENWIGRGNLAILHMSVGELERAEELWRGVADDNALKFINLHQVLLRQRRIPEADSVITRGAELFPEHMVAAGYRLIFLINEGRAAEADSLARHWDAKVTAPGQRTILLWGIGLTEVLRGRVRRGDRMLAESQPLALRVASEETWAMAVTARARAATLIRGDAETALRLLDAALAERPLESLPRFDRAYVPLAIAYAEAGGPETAGQQLAAYERDIPRGLRGSPEPRLLSGGYLALARGRPHDALDTLRRLERLPMRNCPTCGLVPAGVAWERLGEPDSAIAAYTAFADYPQLAFSDESLALPNVLLRLGDLLEARGDTARALRYYDRFTTLWADADAELQPRVRAARERIAALRGGGR